MLWFEQPGVIEAQDDVVLLLLEVGLEQRGGLARRLGRLRKNAGDDLPAVCHPL
jgi:hypothetical protein